MIFRERDPVGHFAPLLGVRVGLRARRALAVVQRAPFTFTMPRSGAVRVHVTYTPGEEPKWSVEALRVQCSADPPP